jgi:hypothetical protein
MSVKSSGERFSHEAVTKDITLKKKSGSKDILLVTYYTRNSASKYQVK